MNPLSFLMQMIRIAIPYLFAASGGVVAERSGIVSLTLEGFMLGGAFNQLFRGHERQGMDLLFNSQCSRALTKCVLVSVRPGAPQIEVNPIA